MKQDSERNLFYTVDHRLRRDGFCRTASALFVKLPQGLVAVARMEDERRRMPGPPVERIRRPEKRDLRPAERRREVHRAGIHAHDQRCPREYCGERQEVEFSGEIDAQTGIVSERAADLREMLLLERIAAPTGQDATQTEFVPDETNDFRPAFGHPVFFDACAAGMNDNKRFALADARRGEELIGCGRVRRRQPQSSVRKVFLRPRGRR